MTIEDPVFDHNRYLDVLILDKLWYENFPTFVRLMYFGMMMIDLKFSVVYNFI